MKKIALIAISILLICCSPCFAEYQPDINPNMDEAEREALKAIYEKVKQEIEQHPPPEYAINDNDAAGCVRAIATAIETYAVANNGSFPLHVSDLTNANPSYLQNACDPDLLAGYVCSVRFNSKGYTIMAHPSVCGVTGTKIFKAATGGLMEEGPCNTDKPQEK